MIMLEVVDAEILVTVILQEVLNTEVFEKNEFRIPAVAPEVVDAH